MRISLVRTASLARLERLNLDVSRTSPLDLPRRSVSVMAEYNSIPT